MKKIWMVLFLGALTMVGNTYAKCNTSDQDNCIKSIVNTEQTVCTMEYAPVCAEVQVQCIKAPCPAIKETFGNKCMMNANKLAKFLYEWECKADRQSIKNTRRLIQSFDDEIATWATLYFDKERIEAKVCNSKSADYSTDWNTLIVGPMMTTEMACMWDIWKYEQYFDLSWATYELSSNWWNHLMITTADWHQYQRVRLNPNPWKPWIANSASTFCIENSGTLEILNWKSWQYGICKFIDGSQCEEWKYFRWECKPEYKKIHNIFDEFFDKYAAKFKTIEDRKMFLKEFKLKIKSLSMWAKLWLKKTYNKIIQAIDIYS